jgi:hypothetical protein
MASPVPRTTHQQSFSGEEYSFTEPVPDDLICAVCHELLNETQQTPCGHLFCKQCLEKVEPNFGKRHQYNRYRSACTYQEERIKCPTCRAVGNEGVFNDRNTDRRVKNLQVACTNGSCEWKGSLCDLDDHKAGRGRKGCEYEPVPCVLGCGEKIVQGNICSQYVEEHLQECPEQKVACPYSDLGCRTLSKRRLLDSHVEESKDQHLQFTMGMVCQLKRIIMEMSDSLDTSHKLCLTTHPWLSNTKSFPSMPWIIRLDDFTKKKVAGVKWTSDPFFTTTTGYKFCLLVYPGGCGEKGENHISVYTALQCGPNDSILSWPFSKTVEVTLLNQLEDRFHHVNTTDFAHAGEGHTQIKPGARSSTGWGKRHFMPHTGLSKSQSQNCQYLKDDCLFFKIELQ